MKIMLDTEVTALFVELWMSIVRMILKRLNTILLNLAGELFEDIKLCYKFDKRLNFCCEEFECKWRDISIG